MPRPLRIVMGDEGARVTASTLQQRPVGGVETAFALLARALARRGHQVVCCVGQEAAEEDEGVLWQPLHAAAALAPADLTIANRAPRLFGRLPCAHLPGLRGRGTRRVLWLHNPAGYLTKPRHLWPLWRWRPELVLLGASHAASLPWCVPPGRHIIPLGLTPPFDQPAPLRAPPAPVAVFASNPLRGLDWLLRVWAEHIHPVLPQAELHCYTGAATYGGDAKLAAGAAPVLAQAEAMVGQGVRILAPLPRPALRQAMLAARVMLYRGDAGETFCLSLAEAQAAGLPAVVGGLGAVAERVTDGVTGAVAADEAGFATAALRLLTDDGLWQARHAAALARTPPLWNAVAAQFEELVEALADVKGRR